jgi:hypothetical protein
LLIWTGNQKKVAHLWNLAGAKERLELVRADLLEEGSFDDAVMACEGVFHTASPIITKSDSKVCCTTDYDYFTAYLISLCWKIKMSCGDGS